MRLILRAAYWAAILVVPGALVVWASCPKARSAGRRLRGRQLDLPKTMGNDDRSPTGPSGVHPTRTCTTTKKDVTHGHA